MNIVQKYYGQVAVDRPNMKVAVITANVGSIDPVFENVEQTPSEGWEVTIHKYTGDSLRRGLAFKPRMQAKIPKMLGWQLVPDMDYYIWLDAAFTLARPDSVEWLVRRCGDADMTVFKHPVRQTILQELEFMEGLWDEYLSSRYEGEPMREQVETYLKDPQFRDTFLCTMGAFIYRNTPRAQKTLKEWFMQNCLWSVQDQLSFPYVVQVKGCEINVMKEHPLQNEYVKYHWSH